jgi:bisphosphoglycerate-dependent phosphoglycerate mutase
MLKKQLFIHWTDLNIGEEGEEEEATRHNKVKQLTKVMTNRKRS